MFSLTLSVQLSEHVTVESHSCIDHINSGAPSKHPMRLHAHQHPGACSLCCPSSGHQRLL